VLAHVTVSRRHSEIRPTHDDFEFADTGSLNATYLNKEAVDSVPVTDGDEIQTGVFRLTFHTTDQQVRRDSNLATSSSRSTTASSPPEMTYSPPSGCTAPATL
jgi:pSer/pThr/pTyr-binding forkhead associated (FHA) protein